MERKASASDTSRTRQVARLQALCRCSECSETIRPLNAQHAARLLLRAWREKGGSK